MKNGIWLSLVDLFRNHKIEFNFDITGIKDLLQHHAAY